ncbi:MAG: RNA polymerase sigma factor [Chloroflexi bacterium]|nr:RNA polymerase sigma factor [Chloroflexota bacterium]
MNTKSQHDSELIQAACAGDTDAIEQVLHQFHPTVTRFAQKYCATPEDVEDAVQETLWIAAQKIGTLRVTSAFVSWLFRIVRNHCYRFLHLKLHEDTVDDFSQFDLIDSNPERLALLKQDVICALAQLPVTYRQVLIMRDIEELTSPEVAYRLGLTVATVKSRLHRARNILRNSLQAWNE